MKLSGYSGSGIDRDFLGRVRIDKVEKLRIFMADDAYRYAL